MLTPRNLKLALAFLLLALAAASCLKPEAPLQETRKVFKLGSQMAWLETPDSSDPFFKGRKFNHPCRLAPEALSGSLASLRYKGLALLSKEKKVFPEPPARELVAVILLALDKAGPEQTVKFAYAAKESAPTLGEIFITGDKLHCRFEQIEGKEYSRHGSRDWLDSWKLMPREGQKYYAASGILGKSPAKNWLVMPLAAPAKAPAPPPSVEEESGQEAAPAAEAAQEDKTLEKDLARLKRLREQDLITEEEYRSKKAELLKRGF